MNLKAIGAVVKAITASHVVEHDYNETEAHNSKNFPSL